MSYNRMVPHLLAGLPAEMLQAPVNVLGRHAVLHQHDDSLGHAGGITLSELAL